MARELEGLAARASGGVLRDALRASSELDAALRCTDEAEWAAEREAQLGALSPNARVLVAGLIGLDASPCDPSSWPDTEARLEALLQGQELIEEALAGRIREMRSIERIWHDLRLGGEPFGLPLGATLGILGLVPLSLAEPPQLLELAGRPSGELVALAIGRAARRHCLAAVDLIQKLLGSAVERPLVLGLLAGLGDGLEADGCRWFARAASRSAFGRAEWLRCAATACRALLARGGPGARELLSTVLGDRRLGLERAYGLLEEVLGLLPRPVGDGLLEELAATWFRRPAPVRGALLRITGRVTGARALPWDQDQSEAVLAEAFTLLARTQPGEVDETRLLALACHPVAGVRRGVVHTLASIRQVPGAPALLPSPDGGEVVSLPASISARTELDRLRAALWAGDSELVPAIVRKLEADERVAGKSALLAAIEVPDMALRRAIVEGLGALGEARALVEVARRFRTLEGSVTEALVAHGATAEVPALAELFERRLKWSDDQAVDDFCQLAGSESLEYLLRAIDTRFYPAARAGAMRGIARLRDRGGVFALRNRALHDAHDECRQAALAALRTLHAPGPSPAELAGFALLAGPIERLEETIERCVSHGPAAFAGLRQTLATGSWKRRRAACAVLAQLPDEDAAELLVGVLLDQDEDVRMAALEGLRKRSWRPRGPREHTLVAAAGRRLAALAEHPERLHLETLEQLLVLGGHVFRSEVLDLLERVEGWRPDSSVVAAARATRLDGEGALECPGGLSALCRTIDRTWQKIPHQAQLSRSLFAVPVQELVAAGADPTLGWRARQALCFAMGRPGADAAVSWLRECMRDDDDDVRRSAMQALAEIGTEGAARALCAGFASPFREDRRPVSQALAAMGGAALRVIEELFDDPWWEAREGAALALTMWRGDRREAADRLIVLGVDPEYKVSQQAREGLTTHGVLPRPEAVARAVSRAQAATLVGLEPWLGLDAWGTATEEAVLTALGRVLAERGPDELPSRLGMVALLRARRFQPWLEEAVLDRQRHLGLRLAAADTLRKLHQLACRLCDGRGALPCPECEGQGERVCERCTGSGMVHGPCPEPDCNAADVTRSIGSRPCETCRGRGQILVGCCCGGGSQPCELCRGTGRNRCPLCEGTGEPGR